MIHTTLTELLASPPAVQRDWAHRSSTPHFQRIQRELAIELRHAPDVARAEQLAIVFDRIRHGRYSA